MLFSVIGFLYADELEKFKSRSGQPGQFGESQWENLVATMGYRLQALKTRKKNK